MEREKKIEEEFIDMYIPEETEKLILDSSVSRLIEYMNEG